jgi:hypothetical protein
VAQVRIRAALAVLMVVFLAGCSAQGASDASGDAAVSEERADAPGVQPQGAPAPAEAEEELSAVKDGSGLSVGDADTDDAAAEAEVEVPAPDTPPITTGDRIIKEGTITIEVKAGEFDVAFRAAISAATRYGGDVIASSSRTDDEGNTSGSVTLRVPVEDFEELMTGVGDIGTIVKRDVGSTDVTAEFTDLESRLRHLQAQERFYLGLLDRAEDVRDAIAVQQQVDGIQNEIEKIQGRLNVLDDRTTYSTLTVALFEPGLATTITDEDPETRPTLARYWDTARDAFVNVVGALLVGAVFLAPLLVVLGAGLLLWMALRRRPQNELPPPAAAERSDTEPPVPVG